MFNKIKELFEKDISLGKKKPKTQEAKKPKAKTLENEKTAQVRAKKTIRMIEKVPEFVSVLSRPVSEKSDTDPNDRSVIYIPDNLKKDYIILLKKQVDPTRKPELMIICSTEKSINLNSDKNFFHLRTLCTQKGFQKIHKLYAAQTIIALLYDKYAKSEKSRSTLDKDGYQKRFDAMLVESIELGVSDIHIETRRDAAVVRYRVNGSLQHADDWEVKYAREMATVIYQVIAAEKDTTFIESQQQSAIIDQVLSNGMRVRVRLNTMPAYPDGFDVVMRLLVMGKSSGDLTLTMLGYSEEQQSTIRASISKPVGCTIISGTTGSGKSTSLSTMITSRINENINPETKSCSIKVITVEDPPEYEIKHATQTPVVRSKAKEGENPFSEAIKAAMRSDPDILMVGEVRDGDSAELLVGAVQSGHQAFTTVHAPSAIGIVSRLRSLGISNDVLGSNEFIAGLIYQALVPVLCTECHRTVEQFEAEIDKHDIANIELMQRLRQVCSEEELKQIRFKGTDKCPHCSGGIKSRTVVAETIMPDEYMFECFSKSEEPRAWKHYKENGGKFALDHGVEKMKMGICDPRDVEHKLGRINNILENSEDFANKVHQKELKELKDIEEKIEQEDNGNTQYIGFDSKLFSDENEKKADNVETLVFGKDED
ncbi:GspE/PulE family protein [Vibrio owensii]|uniref:GspE/PulE family protein n=1 Tax=Vibrio owensii TaxID=696485 RepID=UPI003CC600D6